MAAKKQPAKGTTPGTRYREVAEYRIKDRDVLLAKGRYDAAVYLAGYVIECRLKYAVTVQQNVPCLPMEYETHDWDDLLTGSGARDMLESSQKLKAAFSELLDSWDSRIRYLVKKFDRAAAERFCKLVNDVYGWLQEICP